MSGFGKAAEDAEFEQTRAMLELMIALAQGRQAGEQDGYTDCEDVRALFPVEGE